MKKFLTSFFLFLLAPLFVLIGFYVLTDPFKNHNKFDLNNFSGVNREYVSMELFLKNYPSQKYNSFIFGSSRACGLNVYSWKLCLPKDAKPFLFQAWAETLTGIYQKVNYLNNKGVNLRDVVILIDVPSTFDNEQESTKALSLKDYRLSGRSYMYNQAMFFYAYLKPSIVYESIKNVCHSQPTAITFDTITNDWKNVNYLNYNIKPIQDSTLSKEKFSDRYKGSVSKSLISSEYLDVLVKIKRIFRKRNTRYKIVITPAYTKLAINPDDLKLLNQIFGESNVFNFSGVNSITNDKYNFTDINHFDNVVGWHIFDTLYPNCLDDTLKKDK